MGNKITENIVCACIASIFLPLLSKLFHSFADKVTKAENERLRRLIGFHIEYSILWDKDGNMYCPYCGCINHTLHKNPNAFYWSCPCLGLVAGTSQRIDSIPESIKTVDELRNDIINKASKKNGK